MGFANTTKENWNRCLSFLVFLCFNRMFDAKAPQTPKTEPNGKSTILSKRRANFAWMIRNGSATTNFIYAFIQKRSVAMDLNNIITISEEFFHEKCRICVIKTNNTEDIYYHCYELIVCLCSKVHFPGIVYISRHRYDFTQRLIRNEKTHLKLYLCGLRSTHSSSSAMSSINTFADWYAHTMLVRWSFYVRA